MRIYLDVCCYNRPYDDQSQIKISLETQAKLYIQNMIKTGAVELAASYMLRYECNQNPFEMRKQAILDFVDENMSVFVDIDRQTIIEEKANEIMKTGIKFKDACHIASAIYAKCEYLISTDIRLLKYRTNEIKMINPVDFLIEKDGE